MDMPPVRVAEILGPPGDDPGRAPEVLPGILWEWTKTTTPPQGEAPVEPYFSGITGAHYMVSLIWRVHVPEEGERLWPRASDREAVDVPLTEMREALGDDQNLRRLALDGVTVESTPASALRPGDQVVLLADHGLLDSFGWNPRASGCVVDVSLAGQGSRVPGSGVRGRGSGERETTASSLAGKQQAREKEDNGGQGKDGPAGAIAQGGNGR